MADHLESVKILAKNYRTWAEESEKKGETRLASIQTRRGDALDAVISELEELRRATLPIPSSYGDLSDLPPELLKELTGIKVDETEQQLFNIVKSGGAEIDLDVILIELFRRYQVIQTRKFLQNKLWRMAQKGVIQSVAGRKGVYCVPGNAETNLDIRPNPFVGDYDDDVPF